MFSLLGRMAYRWRWAILIVWGAALLLSLPLLPRVAGSLTVGGFSSPNTEAARAREVLQRELGFAPSTLLVVYRSDELRADTPAFQAAIDRSLAGVRKLPGVTEVILPTTDPGLISGDGDTAYAIVGLSAGPEDAQRLIPEFEAALEPQEKVRTSVAGAGAFYRDIETVSQRDLRRAEVIVFPIALVALLLVFGSVVAALMPLAIGAAGVALVLVSILAATGVTDLSIFVLNLATMLGLGLSVDYSLFVTSRFREELTGNGGNVSKAVERTVATAGKAVFFSGATVLIGLMGLALFEFMFLRSVGIAGVIVVAWSTVAALTLLPALLSVVGTRIDRFSLPWRSTNDTTRNGVWVRLSLAVMARPLAVLLPTLALLLLLGSPFLRVNISSPDATILPPDLPSRQAFDTLVSEFGAGEISPFLIVAQSETPGDLFTRVHLESIYAVGAWLADDPRVTRVQSIVPPTLPREEAIGVAMLQRGLSRLGIGAGAGRLASDNAAVIVAYTSYLPNAEENKALLAELRAMELPGLTLAVDGGTAEIVDVVDLMYADFPKAIALVVVATYLVLLVLFRSLLLPLKAVLMNALSILASYGALVWVFQEGNLSRFLGFTGLGFVEASLPVIMFCVLFGLSMDYEVFLLSRIREEWERTGNNTQAVAVGLQRSGRIITSAALLVVVVAGSFVTADVVLIKALGFGIALAVFLDATVVRALLVPSTMRLLGDWNWWLPSPLHRFLPARPLVEESVSG
ncbi:MAG TPA: MMPL family transporter [Thermomicrobiales bacterium]|nr:MMPL family transporter [Thermomicrobiales bacterium]